MTNEITHEIDETGAALIQALSSFGEENFNTIPFSGSWTGGQVAEHLLKSLSGVLANVDGRVKHTDRDPGEKIAPLRDAFMNFNIKMSSPDFILPSPGPKDKSGLIGSLQTTIAGISAAAREKDLSVTCQEFAMPVLGPLTRLEWISFGVFHAKRHTHQLRNILKALQEPV